jgi:hypothetical protein
MTMNQVEYANHRGVKKQYINRLVSQGVIPLGADKRIDPSVADAILEARSDPSREGVVKSNAERYGKPISPAIQQSLIMHPDEVGIIANLSKLPGPADVNKTVKFGDAKTKREQALAETAEFDLAVKRGEYVERSTAGSLAKSAGKAWRNLLTEVQVTLPSAMIGVVKEYASKLDPDIYLLMEHGFRLAVTEAHRIALTQVANEVKALADSHDAATN